VRTRLSRLRFVSLSKCLLLLALVFASLPVWASWYLPLFDLPNHLAAISVWRNLGDPSFGLDAFYSLNLQPVPYWGYFASVMALSRVVGIEIANKLFITAYVVATVWAVARLARRTGRDPRLALLVFPFLFTASFKWGWLSFLGGVPTFLFSVELLLICIEQPSWKRNLMLAALALLTYAMHILPWFALGVVAIVFLSLSIRRWRAALLAGAALLPSLALAIYNFLHAKPASSSPHSVFRPGKLIAAWEDVHRSLRFMPSRFVNVSDAPIELFTAAIFAAVVLIALVSGFRRQPTPQATPPATRLARWAPEIVAVVLTALYFTLPIHIRQPVRWWGINFRVVPVLGMFLVLLVRGRLDGWRRVLLGAAVMVFAVRAVWLTLEFREFNRRAAGFDRVLTRVPTGASVLFLCFERGDERTFYHAESFSEMGGYIQVRRGGYYPYQFEAGFPMLPKADTRLPGPGWSTSINEFNPAVQASRYAFVLTYVEPAQGVAFRSKGAPVPPLVAESGRWRLYQTGR